MIRFGEQPLTPRVIYEGAKVFNRNSTHLPFWEMKNEGVVGKGGGEWSVSPDSHATRCHSKSTLVCAVPLNQSPRCCRGVRRDFFALGDLVCCSAFSLHAVDAGKEGKKSRDAMRPALYWGVFCLMALYGAMHLKCNLSDNASHKRSFYLGFPQKRLAQNHMLVRCKSKAATASTNVWGGW